MVINAVKVLLIEDNLAEARLLSEILKGSSISFDLTHAKRLGEGLEQLKEYSFDVVLLDLTLPDSQGLESIASLVGKVPELPIVVLTNTNDEELAIQSVRRGAQDYLVKRQVNRDLLSRAMCYAIERKQSEEQLRMVNERLYQGMEQQSAELIKAKEQNQMKMEFVSMLSHDFRNPLNTIMLSTGLLEDSGDRLTKEQKKTYFQMIRKAIKNMDQILSEVLLIGRADSGRLKCDFLELDIKQFCRELVDTFKLNAGNYHNLIFNPQGDFCVGLWDENLLRHILNNLLNNAMKYSPDGGKIEFDLIAEESQVIFRIRDQGIGIPEEDLPALFQPFRRAGNVGSIQGTGLGLAIIKHCVELHGGSIQVASQEGEGTTFTVTLPIQN